MNFASSHVYYYDHSDEEYVSDNEYEQGMTLSDSGEDEGGELIAAACSASGGAEGSEPAKKEKVGGLIHRIGNTVSDLCKGLAGSQPPTAPALQQRNRPKKAETSVSHWKTNPAYGGSITTASDNLPGGPKHCRKWRRADTNVVSIQLNKLVAPSNMHTGDPVRCDNCRGILSYVSKLQEVHSAQTWLCDFCGSSNSVDVLPEEIPSVEDVTYMIAAAPSTKASTSTGLDQSLVVFCMDISGSMCVTKEVEGHIALRGERLSSLQSLNDTGENQWMPGQKRNITYISRLQSIQAAVDHQLETMLKDFPDRRVALVTFNSEVTVIGDGQQQEKVISGDKLGDKEKMMDCAKELAVPEVIKKTRQKLGQKVFDLEEKGQTALGPALLLSVMMACKQPASKVIICTDGMANVGLGSLDCKSDEELETASNFYTQVANMAMEQGVAVSVITIEGTDCKLAELGRVADLTGGQVNIVKPENLTKEFGTILADPIIATNVTAVFTVHNNLYIRDGENNKNWMERIVGNVTADMEITFEFGVRTRQKKRKLSKPEVPDKKLKPESEDEPGTSTNEPGTSTDEPGTSTDEPKASVNEPGTSTDEPGTSTKEPASGTKDTKSTAEEASVPEDLPFQIQVMYTDLEGARAMRVLTQKKPITKDRAQAEQNPDYKVLGVNACQKSATYAAGKDYKSARLTAMMNQRLVYRFSASSESPYMRKAYQDFMTDLTPLDEAVRSEEQSPSISASDDSAVKFYRYKKSPAKTFSETKRSSGNSTDES